MPTDLLDRLLIVRTLPYSVREIMQIADIRAQVEGISLEAEALAKLGEIGDRTSLRFVVQLLTPADVLSKTNGRDTISQDDLTEVDALFHDAKFSARLLAEKADQYVYQ